MTSQLRKAATGAAILVFVALLYGSTLVASSDATTGRKTAGSDIGQPQTVVAAVAAQKVDASVAEGVLNGGSERALLTVRYADTIPPPSEKPPTETDLAAEAHSYSQRKDAALAAAGNDVARIQDFQALPVMLVRIDNADALRRLAALPDVVSIEPDRRNRSDLAQSLPLIRQPQVAAAGDTGGGTAVGVIDTGVDFHRAAFGSCASAGDPGCSVAYAQDFAPDDGSDDDNGHGTNVAGIALGVAPSTSILSLDVFGSGGGAFDSDIIDAIEWAIANKSAYNIRALNLSLGAGDRHTSECSSSAYAAPFQLARSVGILPVVAAGNFAYVNGQYQDGVSSPACAPSAVRVGAVYDSNIGSRSWNPSPHTCTDSSTAADKITCFSQSGQLLSLLAPGSEITAAGITESGTSQATPHVAGAAAVLAAVRPQASSLKIERSLDSSGPTISDSRSGVTRHRLDLVDAVANVKAQDAVIEDQGCNQNVLPANDDGSTGVVGIPFTVNFFGNLYAEAYVNNNGNITFNSPMGTYTPFSITSAVPPIIAPFFADVDTRASGSPLVSYGSTTFGGRPAFCVDWVDVGYFSVHMDKTNSFQLLLVDRSNIGVGDFDIVMNYDRVTWETGDASGGINGFGGTPAAAGYSAGDGDVNHFFAFPGSISAGAFLDVDPGGLVHGSRGSQQPGRYIFPIRNGLAPGNAGLGGTVTAPGGAPLFQAPVQACMSGGQCVTTRTGTDGHYELAALPPGDYQVTAFPPSGSSLLPAGPAPAHLVDGLVTTVDLVLSAPSGPPPGTTITDRGTTEDGIPVINWTDPLTLETTACAGGTVSYRMTLGGSVIRSGNMTESPPGSGHYTASIAALYPDHGNALTTIESVCPNPGDNSQIHFDIYIDPSGVVVDTRGKPVPGATVTLLRSDTADGPFEVVPDGGSEMSPSNRNNPDTTQSDGSFGWDVIAGYYKVRAAKAGCTSAADPAIGYAETGVLTIPPPALHLVLTLDCDDRLSIHLAGSGSGTVSSNPSGVLCGTICSHDFANGAHVELTAVPAANGSTFSGWSGGGCSGTAHCNIALDGDTTVTATFAAAGTKAGGAGAGAGATLRQTTKPLKCRKHFRKKRVHGKVKCIKVRKHHRHKKR